VSFIIDQGGLVSCATGERSSLPDSRVVACVVSAFRQLTFPQPERGRVTVAYPIIFATGQTAPSVKSAREEAATVEAPHGESAAR